MSFLAFVLPLIVISCAPINSKLDPATKEIYRSGFKGERDFKVMLKDTSCKDRIKKDYKVKVDAGRILVLRLTNAELERLLKDDCILYIEIEKKLEPK